MQPIPTTIQLFDHFACEEGHLEVARLLVDSGANKEATCADGSRPLHLAALYGHVEILRLRPEPTRMQ